MPQLPPSDDPARADDSTPFEQRDFLDSDEAKPRRPRRHPDAVHGAARLAQAADLERWMCAPAGDPHATTLTRWSPLVEDPDAPLGLGVLWNRSLVFSEFERNRHILIVGQPGSGKTTAFVMPLLFADLADRERSLIVFDAKGELLPFLHRAAAARGREHELVVINFGDRTHSAGWNPLQDLPRDPQELEAATFALAHTLCWATEVRPDSRDSIFFIASAINLIAGIMQGLSTDKREQPSFARVREVLELPRDALLEWVRAHAEMPGLANFLAYIKSSSWNAETILADAVMRLSAWRDQDLAAVTSVAEFDFDALIERPTILVVEMREADVPRLRPVWNLFCQSLIDHLTRRAARAPGCRLPRPVSLILDEFASSLGRLPNFETAVNTLRGPRVSVVAAVQSLGQIGYLYQAARDVVLAGFNTKIFLPGLERIDAEYAAALAGTMSAELLVEFEEPDPRRRGEWKRVSRQRTSTARALFFPEEIARPPQHFMLGAPATFFLPQTPPCQAFVLRAFELPGTAEVLRSLEREPLGDALLRPEPLGVPGGRAPRPPRALGQTVPEPVLRARVQRLKGELCFERASPTARDWWLACEARHAQQAAELLRLLEGLKEHAVTLEELHAAHRETQRQELRALLHYVHYSRALRGREAAGEPLGERVARRAPEQPEGGG